MDVVGFISHYGYVVVAGFMFLAAIGLPAPMSVVLLTAGAASHGGLKLEYLLPIAWASSVTGDTILYFGGRKTGWWLLTYMCRLTMNPEGCIFSSSAYFYRRGSKTLLFSKWIPGLSSMAAPLAGSLNMRFSRFIRLDAAGVGIYVTTWVMIGYIFSGFIQLIAAWIAKLGHAVALVVLVLVICYAISILVFTLKARKYNKIPRVKPETLRERLAQETPDRLVVIADVRSHGYYDPGMQRIKNSIRVEPTRLKEELEALREFMAPDVDIYLYCSCIRDTTSKRVAHMLEQEHCRTSVIEGGIKAWIRAGGELELVPAADIEHLPRFE